MRAFTENVHSRLAVSIEAACSGVDMRDVAAINPDQVLHYMIHHAWLKGFKWFRVYHRQPMAIMRPEQFFKPHGTRRCTVRNRHRYQRSTQQLSRRVARASIS